MSKRIRTTADLGDELDSSAAWRKKEITTYSSQINRNKSHNQIALLRGAVPVLYAHWEGFCKAAFASYLNFVSNQGLRYEELLLPIFAFTQQRKITAFATQGFGSSHVKIVEDLLLIGPQLALVPHSHDEVNTESNLSYRVLEKLYLSTGLDISHLEPERQMIDLLVQKRNEVAHGENSIIDLEFWREISAKTRDLLDFVRTDIENAAAQGSFKRPLASMAGVFEEQA